MTLHLELTAAVLSTVGSSVFGYQSAQSLTRILSDVSGTELPAYLQWVVGPFGFLIGLLIALRWVTGRLDKTEAKADLREEERDDDRKKLIAALVDSTTTNKNVQDAVTQIRQAIERNTSAVNLCHLQRASMGDQ